MVTKSTELVPDEKGNLDVAVVLDVIRKGGKLRLIEQTNEETAAAMLERTLGATTADELFGGSEAIKAKDILGQSFEVFDVDFRNSDFDEGIGIYVVLHTSLGVIVTGSEDAVVKSIKAKSLGLFPLWLKFTEDTTSNNFKVLNLVKGEAPEEPF